MAVWESRWPRVMAPRLSRRLAMVAINRRSPFTSVVTGRKSGAEAWCVRWVRPRPWIAWSAAPARLQQIVDPALGVRVGQIGVVAAARSSCHREHENAFVAVHEGRRSRARLAEAGRLRSAKRSPLASEILNTRRDRPVTSATASCPKCCTIWSSADGTGGRAASFSISASRRATASWQSTGIAVIVGTRAARRDCRCRR